MLKSKMFLLVALCSAAAWPAASAAQESAHHQHSGMAMPTGDRLGELSFPNSGKPTAQAPFLAA